MSRAVALLVICCAVTQAAEPHFPGEHWETRTPGQAGLDIAQLDAIRDFMQGRGCIVRNGHIVYSWGDIAKRGDVASACKPFNSYFLFRAIEEKLLDSVDIPLMHHVPEIGELNPGLGFKDRTITFRHMATQTSCYGVRENPGEAFNYNDWQMALFFDTLMGQVYQCPLEKLDERVLHPRLTNILQCEDKPTYLPHGLNDRPGRIAISPRDFCRFGLMFLHKGRWRDTRLLSEHHVIKLTTSPLPLSIPKSKGEEAAMLDGQRSMGNRDIPCNLCDHEGSYSWLWWVNGIDRNGQRLWPDAPVDIFAALGHENGMRGLAVIPSLDIVMSWNDTRIGAMPEKPEPLNTVFRLVLESAR